MIKKTIIVLIFLCLFLCEIVWSSMDEGEYDFLKEQQKTSIDITEVINLTKKKCFLEKRKKYILDSLILNICFNDAVKVTKIESKTYYEIERIGKEDQDKEHVYKILVDETPVVLIKKHPVNVSLISDQNYRVTFNYMMEAFNLTPEKMKYGDMQYNKNLMLFKIAYTPEVFNKIKILENKNLKGFQVGGEMQDGNFIYFHIFDTSNNWYFLIFEKKYNGYEKVIDLISRMEVKE